MARADYISGDKNGNIVVDIPQMLFDIYCFAFLTSRQIHLAKYGKNRVRSKWCKVFGKRLCKYGRKQHKIFLETLDSAKVS